MLPGTAKSALDVLVGVASEYFYNVGRTIMFFSDRFANNMTPEVRFARVPRFRLVFIVISGDHSSYLV